MSTSRSNSNSLTFAAASLDVAVSVGRFTVFLLVLSTLLSCTTITPPPARENKLTIIGTGDLQGHLDSVPNSIRVTESSEKTDITGGISRIATMIKQIKQTTNNPVIVVSSGDDLMGRYFRQFDGKAIFGLMEMAGYDVLALGNHDFDSGPGVLAEALDSVNFTTLCSDLVVQRTVMEKNCQPYLLKSYQGIKVGFFSLMTKDFPVVTVTGKVKIRNNQASVAGKMIQTLKKKGARVIIAVTHIGTDVDRRLAADVEGIDIIFGGHSHNYEQNLERVNNTLIVNGGAKGVALVRLDVTLNKNNKVVPTSAAYSLIPVTADIKADAEVEAQLAEYRKQLPETEVIGMTEQEWDLTNATLRSRESAVANLFTDTIRTKFKVDIVLYNGGSFRGNSKYSPGPVTDTMLAEIDEFENNVYLMTVKGRYIRQILEHSATLIGQGGFLQGSGIQFTINTEAQPQTLIGNTNAGFFIYRTGDRIKDIRILSTDDSWQPLDPERNYQLAANDFLVKLGGDRFFWFKKYGRDIHNTYSTMGSVMTDYFRTHKTVNPVGPDGRITIK
jgi:5'-nucleotidase